MKFAGAYSLHNGDAEWERRELSDWLTDLFEAPNIAIEPGCTGQIRNHLRDELTNAGWSYNVRIDPRFDLTVTGMSHDLAFQIQTGNISRAMYDLLKLQYLWTQKKIEAAALAVPTKDAAAIIGSNVSQVDRVWGELQMFDRIVTMPLLVVAFE
ncbi:MAG: restriction endonuclease [Phenylobacterium zucineum]|nr:MAG: restriction endonuclease [Phenylobacterium zucineum]